MLQIPHTYETAAQLGSESSPVFDHRKCWSYIVILAQRRIFPKYQRIGVPNSNSESDITVSSVFEVSRGHNVPRHLHGEVTKNNVTDGITLREITGNAALMPTKRYR